MAFFTLAVINWAEMFVNFIVLLWLQNVWRHESSENIFQCWIKYGAMT